MRSRVHHSAEAGMLMDLLRGIVAAAISVVTVHQVIVFVLNRLGLWPAAPYSTAPIGPLGVPTIVNSVFWGGVWGAVYALLSSVPAGRAGVAAGHDLRLAHAGLLELPSGAAAQGPAPVFRLRFQEAAVGVSSSCPGSALPSPFFTSICKGLSEAAAPLGLLHWAAARI